MQGRQDEIESDSSSKADCYLIILLYKLHDYFLQNSYNIQWAAERAGSINEPAVTQDDKCFGCPLQGQFLAEGVRFFFPGLQVQFNTSHASQTFSCK